MAGAGRMRVAVCVNLDLSQTGGVEVHVLRLAEGLRKQGVVVELFSSHQSHLSKSFAEYDPVQFDIIHTHGCSISRRMYSDLFRNKKEIRHVHTLHGVSLDYLRRCRAWLNWRCYTSTYQECVLARRSDHVITICQAVKNSARKYLRIQNDKMSVIYNGCSPIQVTMEKRKSIRQKFGLTDKHILVIFVGRSEDRVKGAKLVIETMNRIHAENKQVRLLAIPGTGFPEADWFCRGDTINHRDMADYYAAGDLFINASLNEGLPLTVLEAMATPLPVIAAAVGGIPEIIKHNQNGILLKPDRSDLFEQMLRLIDSGHLRKQLSNQAAQSVKQLTWDHIAQETKTMYDHITNV